MSLVPALLSGIVISYFKIIIKRPFDYLKPFGVAFLVFFILGLVFIGVLALMEIDSRLLKSESAIYFIMLIDFLQNPKLKKTVCGELVEP
ncbi:hypothetical protein LP109_14205 [Moraxella bovis]|uniref:hypothetical protein n=1 Tax=Moraxella bovis TaxID=476 RepID=UPI0009CD5B3F|nr:hypothetical protein [Moraxella bovis]AWY21554.1 hypothetical protein DQF64_14280 [Moraxella bovis]OOR89489.1 hypothetical protein B0182_07100 [Moraxella bovis]UZA16735.1 hypothetical protein LP109_14205 [Moraxella bovis]